jgi:hypothetical protein
LEGNRKFCRTTDRLDPFRPSAGRQRRCETLRRVAYVAVVRSSEVGNPGLLGMTKERVAEEDGILFRGYRDALKNRGATIASILVAISSAWMWLGVRNQRRAAPKMAQDAVVASISPSTPARSS